MISEPSFAAQDAVTPQIPEMGSPGYIPLPGSQVTVKDNCAAGKAIGYPQAFPDITSRFSLASLSANGAINYGPFGVTVKNQQYKAAVDYANTDIVPVEMWIGGDGTTFQAFRGTPTSTTGLTKVTVPVLVGVGFRVTAEFVVTEGKADVTGLSVIGASASASKLKGTMMVEALGVSGETLAAAIPLPTKLDQTTVENAILAVGAGRSGMYTNDNSKVSVRPRVVGMLSPGTNPKLVDVIQSEIMRKPIEWVRPCST